MKKAISHIKWFLAYFPVGFIAMITSPVFYPLAEFIELFNVKKNPLWWWLDDHIYDYQKNEDWLIYKENKKFMPMYRWHAFRNTMFNLKYQIKPEIARLNCVWNKEEIVEIINNDLTRDGEKVNIFGDCYEEANWKWIDKYGNEGWQVNSGVKISEKYSTQGILTYWYTANRKLYYRHSFAKIKRQIAFRWSLKFIYMADFYVNFRMGVTDKGYLFSYKRQLKK